MEPYLLNIPHLNWNLKKSNSTIKYQQVLLIADCCLLKITVTIWKKTFIETNFRYRYKS